MFIWKHFVLIESKNPVYLDFSVSEGHDDYSFFYFVYDWRADFVVLHLLLMGIWKARNFMKMKHN